MRRLAPSVAAVALALGTRSAAAPSLVYEITPAPGGSARVVERSPSDASELASSLPRLDAPRDSLRRWIEGSARAVAGYYGRLPVRRVTLALHAASRGAVGYGHTQGEDGGARIDVNLGPETTRASLDDDWVLVHELVHTALPRLPRAATWLDEGLATYVEPIARARAGARGPDKVWTDLAWGLPKGLPGSGDEGLDRTHTWGRTYWGGALFAFLADLEIREATGDRSSLREALVGVLDAGGNVTKAWRLEDVLAAMDAATGTDVVTHLHARMGAEPLDPDLHALFASLGVAVDAGRVTYDDDAPLAGIRRTLAMGAVAR